MPLTATYLVQELTRRMGELVISNPTSGTTTTLIDGLLDQYIPEAVTRNLNVWVYGCATATEGMTPVTALNRAVERRAKAYDPLTHTLTFYVAWPSAISSGSYEIHVRSSRARKLEALNDGVRQLSLSWYRPFMDEVTVTTVPNQWRYALPDAVNLWSSIQEISVQMAPNLSGYPFADASAWNVQAHRETDLGGNSTWYLQFGTMPPPGRLLRLRGCAGYPDLVNESDVLALPQEWNEALGWLYDWAEYRLYQWESNKQPSGQTERLRQTMADRLQAAKAYVLENAPVRRSARYAVPGMGDGQMPGAAAMDPSWLGSFAVP